MNIRLWGVLWMISCSANDAGDADELAAASDAGSDDSGSLGSGLKENDTPDAAVPVADCDPARPGNSAGADGLRSAGGVFYNVRVPSSYESTVGSPLIMVYAAANRDRWEMEEKMEITEQATGRGFVIAYADHLSPTLEAIEELATLPALIAEEWCIDPDRVYLTGHSDGGSVTTILAIWEAFPMAAIAPSAAGINAESLKGVPCPAALPVIVLHSSDDDLFPGFGAEAVAWWAACNGCDVSSVDELENGCLAYASCDGDIDVHYCQGDDGHGHWPDERNSTVLDFFSGF